MIGIALVGYGYWGPNLARNFFRRTDCRLAAVCDLDQARLDKAARECPGADVTSDYASLLAREDIHAVVVATPVSHHYSLAKAALEAGKDVLIEKPITERVEEAEELVRLAGERGRILAVDHTFLFTGAVQKIKGLVDAGAIGELLYFDSVRVNLGLFQPDVNVIYDLAPHDISILCHLVAEDPKWVQAMAAVHAPSGQEYQAYIHLDYGSGRNAHFHLNWLAPVKIRRTLIGGTEKMIVYDDLDASEKVKVYDKGITVVDADPESLRKIKIDYRTGDMHAPKLAHQEALAVEAGHFVHCVREREQPLADGREGLRVLRIIDACQRSLAADGARVPLEG